MENRNLGKIIAEFNKEIIMELLTSMRKSNELRLVLTVPEVAKLIRLNQTKVYEMVKTGDIPSIKHGNRILIPITALVEWLDQSAWDKPA